MANNQLYGGILILAGSAIAYYGLFIEGTSIDKSEEDVDDIQPIEVPSILLKDDRTTFTGPTETIPPTNTNTVNQANIGNGVKGYSMPRSMSDLKPISGIVMIITKPGTESFGEGAKTLLPVTPIYSDNTLIYKSHSGVLFKEEYEKVKSKIILPDKKYLK